jgi:hypothetical protein
MGHQYVEREKDNSIRRVVNKTSYQNKNNCHVLSPYN